MFFIKAGIKTCAGQYADFLKGQDIKDVFLETLHIATNAFYNKKTKTVSSYKEVKLMSAPKDVKPKNEIFEAINQLVKYVSYQIGEYLTVYKERKMEANSCFLFFPVIVFDGDLYTAVLKDSEISPESANHLLYVAHYKPKYEVRRVPFLIEVVSRKFFPQYLLIVEKRINKMNGIIEKQSDMKELLIECLTKQT